MRFETQDDRSYSQQAIWLHWTIAGLILFNLAVGFFMPEMRPPFRKLVIALHISSGLTVLLLTVLRVVVRLRSRPPPFLPETRPWEVRVAHLVHGLLYAGMVAMPLTGWAIISANPPKGSAGAVAAQERSDRVLAMGVPPEDIRPVRVSGANRFWWIAPLPPIEPLARMGASPDGLDRQWKIHEASHGSHRFGAYLLIALLVLHVGGALKHQFLDRQPILARLRPRLVRRRRDG